MDIQKLKKYYKKDGSLFGEVLNLLSHKYALLIDRACVNDFYVQDGFHSITLEKNNHFINIEVHKNRIELKMDFILFLLPFEDYAKDTIFEMLNSVIEGRYEITEYRNNKGSLGKLQILWKSPQLELLNRLEKLTLIGNYKHQQTIKGTNFVIQA